MMRPTQSGTMRAPLWVAWLAVVTGTALFAIAMVAPVIAYPLMFE